MLLAFAALAPDLSGTIGQGLVHGLKLTAVAVVAQAVWDMGRRLCPDRRRSAIALAAIALLSTMHTVYAQLVVIALGALAGLALYRNDIEFDARGLPITTQALQRRVSHTAGVVALVSFCALLAGLPVLLRFSPMLGGTAAQTLGSFDAFFRSGALVFGGGHVVLPLLQQQPLIHATVEPNELLAGYGAAQAVPGPLFSFAAYLGWMMPGAGGRIEGAALATVAIFLPGLLLVVAALPHWQALRARRSTATMFAGVNAAVVGLLATALYSPVWTSAVHAPIDFAIAAAGFVLLVRWKTPPLAVVTLCALAGAGTAVWAG